MRGFLLSVGVLLLLVGSVMGQQCQNCANGQCGQQAAVQARVAEYPALVGVDYVNSQSAMCGSGFIIDRNATDQTATVLTCAHGYDPTRDAVVRTQDGKRYNAAMLHSDAMNDTCILKIHDPGLMPFRLAEKEPAIGDRVFAAGFADADLRRYSGYWGTMKAYDSFQENGPNNVLVTTCYGQEGCSGGPILNEHAEAVGVITGGPRGGGAVFGPSLNRTLALYQQAFLPGVRRIQQSEQQDAQAIKQIGANQQQLAANEQQILAEVRGIANRPTPAAPCCPAQVPQADPRVDQALGIASQAEQKADALGKAVDSVGKDVGDVKKDIGDVKGALGPLLKLHAKLEADEAAGGLKGKIAGQILKVTGTEDGATAAGGEDPILHSNAARILGVIVLLAAAAFLIYKHGKGIETKLEAAGDALKTKAVAAAAANPSLAPLATAATSADGLLHQVLAKVDTLHDKVDQNTVVSTQAAQAAAVAANK